MAPKAATTPKFLVVPENTNFLVIMSDSEANPRYKCFSRFISKSYLKGALFSRPTLYLDILESFWNSVSYEEVALEIAETKFMVTCTIKNVIIISSDEDFNKSLELPEENLYHVAIEQELVEFMELIHYEVDIDLAILNKKHVIREWSFIFDYI